MKPRAVEAYPRRWRALAVLSLVLVVIGLDNLVVNVALPTLVRDLGASGSQLQWIVDAYVLVFAGLLLSMGSLGDRFGRKRALNAGLLVFVAGSMAAAFAGSAEVLIATRAVMGLGAALIMPSTLSIITNTFPENERGRAIGIWAGVAALGIVLGPVVGGWLLERFWWGSVFLINVPIVAVALLAAWPLVPESRDPRATALDPAGALLSVAGLVVLVYGIIEVPSNGWSDPVTLGSFGAAAALLAAFVAWELHSSHPMLNMAFFRNPRFSAASATLALASFAMLGTIFVLTQHLQFVLGYTPLQAGVRMLPALTLMVSAPLSARAVPRVGTKAVVVAGMLIVGAGLWLFSAASVADGYGPVAWALALFGFGLGLVLAPSTEAIMGSLPLAKTGVGSAMNDTTRLVGGALGVAVFGTAMSSAYASRIAPALSGLPAPAAAAARDSVGAATLVAGRLGPEGTALLAAARSASAGAMDAAVLVGLAGALAGALVALLLLPSRPVASVDDQPVELQSAGADVPTRGVRARRLPAHRATNTQLQAANEYRGLGWTAARLSTHRVLPHGRAVAAADGTHRAAGAPWLHGTWQIVSRSEGQETTMGCEPGCGCDDEHDGRQHNHDHTSGQDASRGPGCLGSAVRDDDPKPGTKASGRAPS